MRVYGFLIITDIIYEYKCKNVLLKQLMSYFYTAFVHQPQPSELSYKKKTACKTKIKQFKKSGVLLKTLSNKSRLRGKLKKTLIYIETCIYVGGKWKYDNCKE